MVLKKSYTYNFLPHVDILIPSEKIRNTGEFPNPEGIPWKQHRNPRNSFRQSDNDISDYTCVFLCFIPRTLFTLFLSVCNLGTTFSCNRDRHHG